MRIRDTTFVSHGSGGPTPSVFSSMRAVRMMALLLASLFAAMIAPRVAAADDTNSFLAFYAIRNDEITALYRTTGTPSGTERLLHLDKTSRNAQPYRTSFHNASGGAIFIVGVHLKPATAGVYLIDAENRPKRLTADPDLRDVVEIYPIRMVDGLLFFLVNNSILFVSDGTEMGTHRATNQTVSDVVDIFAFRTHYIVMTNQLAGSNPNRKGRIYRLDLNRKTLHLIHQFTTINGQFPDTRIEWLANLTVQKAAVVGLHRNRFVFTRWGAMRGLWVSNGTSSGTRPLAANEQFAFSAGNFAEIGAGALFTARTDATGSELWITNGISGGTRRLRDIAPGPASSWIELNQAVAQGGRIYFPATTYTGERLNRSIWVTDGTPAGTVPVRTDVGGRPVWLSSVAYPSSTNELAVVDNSLFFAGTEREGTCSSDSSTACRLTTALYSHNLTTGETAKRSSPSRLYCSFANREYFGSDHRGIRAFGNKVFFSSAGHGGSSRGSYCAYGGANAEPWVFDATTGETRQLLEIGAGFSGSMPVPIGSR